MDWNESSEPAWVTEFDQVEKKAHPGEWATRDSDDILNVRLWDESIKKIVSWIRVDFWQLIFFVDASGLAPDLTSDGFRMPDDVSTEPVMVFIYLSRKKLFQLPFPGGHCAARASKVS